MKKYRTLSILLVVVCLMTGCGTDSSTTRSNTTGTASVSEVVSAQMDSADRSAETDTTSDAEEAQASASDAATVKTVSDTKLSDDVDYDLTSMSSELVYSMVYQMVNSPDNYIGKTFRITGSYYASYYETTGQYYYYCLIADATSCCSQGLEFVWGDGSHVYPDEYPEDYTDIVVQGTFETYVDGDGYTYCHLANASMVEA